MVQEPIQLNSSPYSIFILAIRSPTTREKYLQRLGYFLDYIGIGEQGTIEERCNIFGENAKGDINWLANNNYFNDNAPPIVTGVEPPQRIWVGTLFDPSNALRPVNISYITAPSANTSARRSTSRPSSCSGAM